MNVKCNNIDYYFESDTSYANGKSKSVNHLSLYPKSDNEIPRIVKMQGEAENTDQTNDFIEELVEISSGYKSYKFKKQL
jgi:hypothetical protein